MQELVFPGYFGISGLDASNISARTHSLVYSLFDDLASQVWRCLLNESNGDLREPLRQKAEQCALEFIEKIPELRGAGASAVKSAAFASVSEQPELPRRAAVVLLRPGAAPVPS